MITWTDNPKIDSLAVDLLSRIRNFEKRASFKKSAISKMSPASMIVAAIKKRGGLVRLNLLTRMTQSLNKQERDATIRELVSLGVIELSVELSGGRAATSVKLVDGSWVDSVDLVGPSDAIQKLEEATKDLILSASSMLEIIQKEKHRIA